MLLNARLQLELSPALFFSDCAGNGGAPVEEILFENCFRLSNLYGKLLFSRFVYIGEGAFSDDDLLLSEEPGCEPLFGVHASFLVRVVAFGDVNREARNVEALFCEAPDGEMRLRNNECSKSRLEVKKRRP